MLVGKYALPLTGFIEVFDRSNNLAATTGTAVSVWGEDVYKAPSAATSTTASTTSTTSTATTSTTTTSSTTSSSSMTTAAPGGITVYANRIPASYLDPCFATSCSAGTGPGATMYFELYDSFGNVVQTGYADEHGYTFTGLNPSTTYYVYPEDCDMCHGSLHDVVFQHWGDNSTVRPRAAMVGSSLDVWYSCTNNCAGG